MDNFYIPAYKSISDECGKKVQKIYDKETWRYYCVYKKAWFDYNICKNCKYNKSKEVGVIYGYKM